jgi:hypothetical protein
MGEAQVLSHEEIVKNFVATKAVDYNALGQFVAQYGESIAISGRGDYGVRIGWYNLLACFWIVDPYLRHSPIEVAGRGIGPEVIGR